MTHCTSCGAPARRLKVRHAAHDHGRYILFDEDERGAWIQDPISGYMRRIGRPGTSETNLERYQVHSCVNSELACD